MRAPFMKGMLSAAGALLLAAVAGCALGSWMSAEIRPADAQMRTPTPNIPLNDAMGQFWSLKTQDDGSGNQEPVTATAALGATSINTGGSITTGGTFQSVLAANANRNGCQIQNTSANVEYVFFGANASATEATSLQLAAGASITCASGGIVRTDNVSMTSGTAASTFVVNAQ